MVSVSGLVLPAAYFTLVGTAAVTGMPSGAGLAVAGVNTAACIVCMANPVGWFMSESKYNEAASTIKTEQSSIAPLVANVKGVWEGDSMEAFQRYFEQRVDPAMDGLHAVTSSLGKVMHAGGMAEASFILGLVASTTALIGAFVAIAAAAAASTVAAPAVIQAQWAPAAAWITFAIATATAIMNFMNSINSAVTEIQTTHLPALKGATAVISGRNPLVMPTISNISQAKKVSEVIDQYKNNG